MKNMIVSFEIEELLVYNYGIYDIYSIFYWLHVHEK